MALISLYAIASLALNFYPELHILTSNWLLNISTGILCFSVRNCLVPSTCLFPHFPILIMALLLIQTNPLGVSLSFTCLYTLSSSSVNLPSEHIWVWTILRNFGPSQNIVPPGAFRCYKNPPWSVSPASSFTVFLFTHLLWYPWPCLDSDSQVWMCPRAFYLAFPLPGCFLSRYRHVLSSCFNLLWPLMSVPQRVLSWSFYLKQACPPHHSSCTTSVLVNFLISVHHYVRFHYIRILHLSQPFIYLFTAVSPRPQILTHEWCSSVLFSAWTLQMFTESLGSVQSLSHVWLFTTPWTAACQASLSITNSQSLIKLRFIE